ncbi:CD109 antigen-like [Limulus polyphemus]|uniref:CD109 antigen-like n=1 Tax=Limulus polyphemus TaxID=6850 RepID=A0ABM1SVH6_LIMPO|nr:CD109 antigen-like [Limulus polyphemus]XP_022247631.1 CD109 antigen-like [Limulus polyphemus]XP_022247632.1 CD109 antigen-like [Limulus polyphemus]
MFSVQILVCLCFFAFFVAASEKEIIANGTEVPPAVGGTYTIVAPAKLRPHLEYHVSISVYDVQSPVELTVAVAGPADNGNFNNMNSVVTLNSGDTRIVNFQIGEWGPGKYKLTVSGQGGLSFRNETSLEYEQKSYSVFIQTDKAIYKPNQLVQFRVIVVNPYLIPSVTGAIDIHITDGKDNRVKQWKRVFTSKGIVSLKFQLADQPVLGDWDIVVNVLGQSFNKSFTVAEYVLPTFEVKIDLPAYATYSNSSILATVRAMYTYGKPVKGDLILTVTSLSRYSSFSEREQQRIQKEVSINGNVDIQLNLLKDLKLHKDTFREEVEFFAVVKEDLTNRKYNTTSVLWIYDNDVKVELVKTSETFKPGLKYTCFLKVAYQDDTPVDYRENQLKVMYGFSYDENAWKTSMHWIPQNGLVKLDFYPPNRDVYVLGMQAEYLGNIHYIDSIEAAHSPSNNFIQVAMLTTSPVVGQNAEFQVNATEPISQFVYQVMGRGDIIYAQMVKVPEVSTYNFSFPLNHRMAPKARVIVYYVRDENKEVIADAVNFEVDGIFRTEVDLSTDVQTTKPGGQIEVQVKTKPNAYVGILAIDQSVLLMKSGNDITQQNVVEELGTYDTGKKNKFWPPWYRQRRTRSLWWPGSTSASQIFSDSGVVILTNGFVYKHEELIFYRSYPVAMEDDPSLKTMNDVQSVNNKDKSSVRLRKYFPETWLWTDTEASDDGIASVSSKVPDTITSWVVSAFAMDSVAGLGIAPSTTKVTVFRPFFIKLNLPYSILRGESVAIKAVIFNYHNKPIKAKVTMENNDGDFEFTVVGNEVTPDQGLQKRRSKRISIPAQDGAPVSFIITPRRLGYIDIRMSATSQLAGDAVLKRLLVKPEGSTQYFNKAVLVDLRNPGTPPIKKNISVPIPNNVVPGSERITVSGIGDLMGPHVNNMEELLHMPYGCGEQNMLKFVPNIVVLDYLTRAGRLTPTVERRAKEFMESGYQRELTYKRDEGSFSAFGNGDKSGSTWLTAFVVKSFHQALPYIDIDPAVIEQSLKWLSQQQMSDGSFNEPGEVHFKRMQGGAGKGIALTAYVLIAFLENQAQQSYSNIIKAAERYLIQQLPVLLDPYSLSIVTYALHLSDNSAKDEAFQKFLSLAEKQGDFLYWKGSEPLIDTTDKHSDHFFLPDSMDIEVTAYALLTYTLRAEIGKAVSIMRWLVSQQNENGGFSSTQDTVIGIQALGQLAARIVTSTISVNVTFRHGNGVTRTMNISSSNAVILQSIELPKTTRYVELEPTGFGIALVQVSWAFNLAVSAEHSPFSLNPFLEKTATRDYLQLTVCTRNNEDEPSNMAVMDVTLPSGYLADVDALPNILNTPNTKRVEAADGQTKVIIYFDKLDQDEICLMVPAHLNSKVAHQKPVPVMVYDYYNRVKTARMFYSPHNATVCDICEEDECSKECNEVSDGDGSFSLEASVFVVLIGTILARC